MLRAILMAIESFTTWDFDEPGLEELLRRGGFGEVLTEMFMTLAEKVRALLPATT